MKGGVNDSEDDEESACDLIDECNSPTMPTLNTSKIYFINHSRG